MHVLYKQIPEREGYSSTDPVIFAQGKGTKWVVPAGLFKGHLICRKYELAYRILTAQNVNKTGIPSKHGLQVIGRSVYAAGRGECVML